MDQYPLKWVTESLAVGYASRSEDHLHVVRAAGIQAIVNLCAECYDLHDAEKQAGFEVFYLPVADDAAPTLEELDHLISWMKIQNDLKRKTLVHCRYGIGRTGTVVLAFLIHLKYDFKKAEKLMSKPPAWPSNRTQKDLVDRYIIKLQKISIKDNFSTTKPNPVSKYFEKWKTFLEWDD